MQPVQQQPGFGQQQYDKTMTVQQTTYNTGQPSQPAAWSTTGQPAQASTVAPSMTQQSVPMATATAVQPQPGGTAGVTAGKANKGQMVKQLWGDLKGAVADISSKFQSSMNKTSTTGANQRTGSVGATSAMPPGSTAPVMPIAASTATTQATSTATYPAGTLPTGTFPTAVPTGQPSQVVMASQPQQAFGTIGQQPQISGSNIAGAGSGSNVPVFDAK